MGSQPNRTSSQGECEQRMREEQDCIMIRSFWVKEQRSARKALWGRLQVGTISTAELPTADNWLSHQLIVSLRHQKTRRLIVLFPSRTPRELRLTTKSASKYSANVLGVGRTSMVLRVSLSRVDVRSKPDVHLRPLSYTQSLKWRKNSDVDEPLKEATQHMSSCRVKTETSTDGIPTWKARTRSELQSGLR